MCQTFISFFCHHTPPPDSLFFLLPLSKIPSSHLLFSSYLIHQSCYLLPRTPAPPPLPLSEAAENPIPRGAG